MSEAYERHLGDWRELVARVDAIEVHAEECDAASGGRCTCGRERHVARRLGRVIHAVVLRLEQRTMDDPGVREVSDLTHEDCLEAARLEAMRG